jgi:rhamnulokinase
MMSTTGYVAFDLGAESGRAMLATMQGQGADQCVELQEVHRFANNGIMELPDGIHWNFTALWLELVEGLKKCVKLADQQDIKLVSIGVDTWGVDFGVIGKSGQLLGLPFAYRDPSHEKALDIAFSKVSREAMYDATGVQIIWINSVFQLIARNEQEPEQLRITDKLLFIPDLLHYFFCGNAVNEATIASTSGVTDARTRTWAGKLIEDLGLPRHIFGKIVTPGTALGKLLPHVSQQVGLPADNDIQVVAPAAHDTASAIAAVPYDAANGKGDGTWAYVSSGTWSLIGAELSAPVINEASRKANFTNEWGVGNTIRFLKNITGLWLVQEVRRDYAKQGQEFEYAQLADLAAEAEPMRTLVDPSHSSFNLPGDMTGKIAAFARETNQPEPQDPGQFIRCCLESLAFAYRSVVIGLEEVLEKKIEVLHVVGGGGKNALLNQLTANAIGRPVVVGPFEATAVGNALTQALGTGQVKDLAHIRQIVRNSFDIQTFEPADPGDFDANWQRYQGLVGK